MNSISSLIKNYNEENLIKQYKFSKYNFNGIEVMYNPSLAIDKHYIKAKQLKSKIVVHHTAGAIWGDIPTLLNPSKISTAFVISPQGTIYMLFQPQFWANHLGKNAIGGNTVQSKLSIGIELSNFGYLVQKGDELFTYTGRLYCTKTDTDQYDLVHTWKGPEYFCKYTDAQYESLKKLKDVLCKTFNIPNVLFPKIRENFQPEVETFKGITTHINFRKDKFDVSPNFDWSKLGFKPSSTTVPTLQPTPYNPPVNS